MKRRQLRGERGGATVEFAIISIVLISIVFGIIEFGILMFDQHVLTNASREGARLGVVMRVPRVPDVVANPDCDVTPKVVGIKDAVLCYAKENMVSFGASGPLDFDDIDVFPAEADRSGPLFGTELKVTVAYQYDFLILSIFGLPSVPLKAETIMRME